jgi:zinc protease
MGRLALAMRDNEHRVRFLGFNTHLAKTLVFAISAMFAGVAGALLAVANEATNYTIFGTAASANVVLQTFIGGAGTFFGPALGAAVMTFFGRVTSDVRTVEEDIDFINRVTVADLRRLHSEFLGATGAEVVVVGDFDPQAVQDLITKGLGEWQSPKPFSDVLNLYANLATDPTQQVFNTPDKENAFFLAGMPIEMRDSHPDYPALVMGNYILGSGPASRLFGRIRGREGLSYGVGSGFGASPRSDGATFTVNAIAAPQNAEKVEASFRDELTTILREGYTEDELAQAKVSWAQQRQVGRTQDGGLAATLGLWAHVGRTMAWDAEFEAKVQALTVAEIREAMNRHLDLSKMTFMRGGDFEGGGAAGQ